MDMKEFCEELFKKKLTIEKFERLCYRMALVNSLERFLTAYYDRLAEEYVKVS